MKSFMVGLSLVGAFAMAHAQSHLADASAIRVDDEGKVTITGKIGVISGSYDKKSNAIFLDVETARQTIKTGLRCNDVKEAMTDLNDAVQDLAGQIFTALRKDGIASTSSIKRTMGPDREKDQQSIQTAVEGKLVAELKRELPKFAPHCK